MLTQKRLKKLLKYKKKTGIFRWRVTFNSRAVKGSIAGNINSKDKYIVITIEGVRYVASRLAFFYVKGYFPEHFVDHKDRNTKNNKWKNLREATNQCNQRNTGNWGTSGAVKGVTYVTCKHSVPVWRATIGINCKPKYIGSSPYFAEAVAMRLAAEQCLDWTNCDSHSPAKMYVEKYKQLGWIHKLPVTKL